MTWPVPKLIRPLTPGLLVLTGGLAIALQGSELTWQTHSGYRVASLKVPESGKPGFESLPAASTGIHFQNTLSPAFQSKNHNLLNGSGLALGDVDGDGRCDLYLCRLSGPNALYRNLGNWQFEDIAPSAGVDLPQSFSRGAAFADLDGDGDLDLIVTLSGTGAKLFLNDGTGRFTPHHPRSLYARNGATSAVLADIDNDGDLDLYVTNYGEETIRSGAVLSYRRRGNQMIITGKWRNRVRVIDGNHIEFGEPDRLYRNDGTGRFTLVPWTAGAFRDEQGQVLKDEPWDMGLSAMFRDINQDGHPDLYVCNDFQQPDRFWINDGQGRFQAIPRLAIRQSPYFSMGIDFGDLNRDGLDDFMVVDMASPSHPLRMTQIAPETPPISETLEARLDRPQFRRNMFYLNRGDDTFAEIAQLSGLHASDWTWCPVFLDVDLDGYEDILTVNGHAFDTQDLDTIDFNNQFPKDSPQRKPLHQFPKLRTPNVAFRNRGDLTFERVSEAWGFDSSEVSHGIGLADLDLDGDLDAVVNCLNSPPLLYRNTGSQPRLVVRLRGARGNTAGVGARILVKGGPREQSQEIICGGRYLASDDTLRTFACPAQNAPLSIEVRWRSGRRSLVEGVQANHLYEIIEPSPNPSTERTPPPAEQEPLFTNQSTNLKHRHRDAKYNDFIRQPALSRSLSHLGPGLAWVDLNGDSREDLVIGSGRGGRLEALLNEGKGTFRPAPRFRRPPDPYDLVGIAALGAPASGPAFVIGATNYEFPIAKPSLLRCYTQNGQRSEVALPNTETSIGPLSLCDLDHDGDLDLFVGGRCKPGQFPQPASSYLFENTNGEFRYDPQRSSPFASVGNVSGSLWSDLNGDGWPDLVLACDSGPLRVFANQSGTLLEQTEAWGLSDEIGLWNGIATGDFNGDGRPDLIASNWGQNHRHQVHRDHPIILRYGDIQGDQVTDSVEAYFAKSLDAYVPYRLRDHLSQVMPSIAQRFATHAAYSRATLDAIWEPQASFRDLAIQRLESMLYLNRGNRFEGQALPSAAQFAPGTAVCVSDFDGDGNEDVFMGQNISALNQEISPLNAGRGLVLLGSGKGTFDALDGAESGIRVYGDQRGAAIGDFNQDHRPDLVISQNNEATQLYQNLSGRPGFQVRLKGGAENPAAVGAALRLRYGAESGPLREIQAGSGYWSQNTLVPLLPRREDPQSIWVRWPDGHETTTTIPAGSIGITLTQEGSIVENPMP